MKDRCLRHSRHSIASAGTLHLKETFSEVVRCAPPSLRSEELADDYAASTLASAETIALMALRIPCALIATSVRFFADSFFMIFRR